MSIIDFDSPPVVETVLSVGFNPVEGLTAAQIGRFWAGIDEEFPQASEQPPYDMPLERLAEGPGLRLEMTLGPSIPRTRAWLISQDDRRLIQIQRDWFAYNWRFRSGEGYAEARYEQRRDSFIRHFKAFDAFIEDHKLGSVEPRQCEVTYINHVSATGSAADDLADILRFVSKPSLSRLASRIEAWDTAVTILLRHDNDVFGRLHISARPGPITGPRVWQIDLTARGRPLGAGIEGTVKFFDLGHEAIVTGFRDITTDRMHKEWGLQ